MKIKMFALTDVGMVREKNEDSCWARDFGNMAVLLVADGMGGHGHGDVASQTAVAAMRQRLEQYERRKRKRRGVDAVILEEAILEAMDAAHRRIRAKGASMGGPLSMGTTCTIAVISEETSFVDSRQLMVDSKKKRKEKRIKVTVGHIGDSKLYHVREKLIVQKSTDHTMLQRMLDAGALKPEEAAHFGHKNIIYKSLGGGENLELDPIKDFDLEPGDALLLCSDGLSNYIQPEEMARILAGTPSLKAAARYMVNLAKYRGGDDNITVVLAEHGDYVRDRFVKLNHVPRTARPTGGSGRRLAVFSLLAVLLILCLLLYYVLRSGVREQTTRAKPLNAKQGRVAQLKKARIETPKRAEEIASNKGEEEIPQATETEVTQENK